MNDIAMWIGYAVMIAGGVTLVGLAIAFAFTSFSADIQKAYDIMKVVDMVRYCERKKE